MNLTIGLSGLRVAQRAIDLIGTNIANVATDGYHRQDPLIQPIAMDRAMSVPVGGARIASYRRSVDRLLENEIRRQHPSYTQVSQELVTLQSLEGAFGTLGSQGLANAMNSFFGALGELATDPASQALREQVVWAADALAANFRNLGATLGEMDEQIWIEAQNVVREINGLAGEVAELNGQIEALSLGGDEPNLLIDRRDQAILELADLVDVQAVTRLDGSNVTDVVISGTPLVVSGKAYDLTVTMLADGRLGLGVTGLGQYDTDIQGGKLGALFALKNELVADVRAEVDALAVEIMTQLNRLHAQGVGTAGAFDELTGVSFTDADATLDTWSTAVAAGEIHLRLIDPDGQVTYHTVAVDPATDTLNTVAAALNGLDPAHLSASVVNTCLHVEGMAGYRFDFLPASTVELDPLWSGTSSPELSGIYMQAANDTFTCTLHGTGTIGVDDDLTVEVRNGAGELVTTLDIGSGYASGDALDIYAGLEVAFQAGDVTDGDQFVVTALADADTSGFLAAAGMNTLFSGTTAADMGIRSEVLDDPSRLATAIGPDGVDNLAVLRMADIGEQELDALGHLSPGDFQRLIVTGLGQKIAVRDARRDALQNVLQQLENQRDNISGVDLNDEAASLIMFEQMFQSMARVLGTQQQAMQTLTELL